VTETNPLERTTIYTPESLGRYFSQIDGQPSPNCVGDARSITNSSSRIDMVDKEGRRTRINKNSKGWATSKIVDRDGAAVTTSTTWHPIYRLPLQRVMPGLTTDYTYDVTSIDGPLPGPTDTQTFAYAGEKLTSVTNELGHQTLITAHNPNGAPARIEDPNGNVTD